MKCVMKRLRGVLFGVWVVVGALGEASSAAPVAIGGGLSATGVPLTVIDHQGEAISAVGLAGAINGGGLDLVFRLLLIDAVNRVGEPPPAAMFAGMGQWGIQMISAQFNLPVGNGVSLVQGLPGSQHIVGIAAQAIGGGNVQMGQAQKMDNGCLEGQLVRVPLVITPGSGQHGPIEATIMFMVTPAGRVVTLSVITDQGEQIPLPT